MLSKVVAQSAEKGAWPEVMCATQADLPTLNLYGPTKRAQTVGPVDICPLDDVALDANMAERLWQISEQKTGLKWAV